MEGLERLLGKLETMQTLLDRRLEQITVENNKAMTTQSVIMAKIERIEEEHAVFSKTIVEMNKKINYAAGAVAVISSLVVFLGDRVVEILGFKN